ncbi:zf-MIZ-domain-containing protein, partial [Suhomyces tanzawaensis NRRL Y-17324]
TDSQSYKGHSLYFKESPFYTLRRQIHGSPQACLPLTGKGVCPFTFLFTKEEANLVYLGDPTVRVYLMCGLQDPKTVSSTEVPLQFPLPVEVHVNGTQVTKNFRGIKGKPGTAKPADITELLKPSQNKVQVIYTQTTETYLVYIYIVNVVSCEEIIKNIQQKPLLHKSATVSKIVLQNQGDDEDDIVISSSSITLRDPLSYTKMQYPVQSIFCNHAQCFDGLVFLQSQLQLPSWNCPICGTALRIEDLSISEYFTEVLKSVPEDVDSVQINEDGSW